MNYYNDADDDDFDAGDFLSMIFAPDAIRAGAGKPIKAPMTIYRIEMPNGHGPYNSGLPNAHEIYDTICARREGFDCAHLATGEQCGVTEREFEKTHGIALYACDSLEALFNWFPRPAREYLAQYDAKIIVYEAPKGAHIERIHNGELLFTPHEVNRKSTLDLLCEEIDRAEAA